MKQATTPCISCGVMVAVSEYIPLTAAKCPPCLARWYAEEDAREAREEAAARAQYEAELAAYPARLAAWEAAVTECATGGHKKGPYMYGARVGFGFVCHRCGYIYNGWYGIVESTGRPCRPAKPVGGGEE